MSENWYGRDLELRLGNPGHGGFCVARHEGRVVFVRHGLPGELVRARVTEDRGGSFCRADAVEVLEASADRVDPLCPISGPGGAGCCDLSYAALPAQRRIKAAVVAEQLRRLAGVDRDVEVEDLPGTGDGTGWRTRLRLAVDADGHAGFHGYRSTRVITNLACPQPVSGSYEGIAERVWRPGAELQVTVDAAGERHVVEIEPAHVSRTGRRSPGRRGATARRAATSRSRREHPVIGGGRAVARVGDREWELSATGFWQAHRGAAQRYSQVVGEWSGLAAGETAWDLYGGVGVFAAVLAAQVGEGGSVLSVESATGAVEAGRRALADLPQVRFEAARVENVVTRLAGPVSTVVLDPPRSGAGRAVVDAVGAAGPRTVVHIGCDPAAFGRDVGLYLAQGYQLADVRAFDAFPLTHHVECIALLHR
ncbi:class I SAM-dependent RNA methyltransferase [Rhodococcus sp. NPDC003318]|uniref:class I SAM-dependent RNA methyltransferase n=1 Tax=Rhodococcus sp. NPDC003318 TaxID=3364503 RepID=UPI0036AEF651